MYSSGYNVQIPGSGRNPRKKRRKPEGAEEILCSVCDIWVEGVPQYQAHINGTKHERRAKEKQVDQVIERMPFMKYDDELGAYMCQVCEVSLNSSLVAMMHVNGFRHKDNMEAYEQERQEVITYGTGHKSSADRFPSNGTTALTRKRERKPSEEDREREILEKVARTLTPINIRCATSSAVPVFECTVCEIRTNSELQLKQHMESAKHKYKTSRQVASSEEAALPTQPEVAPTPQTSVAPPTQSKVAPPTQFTAAPTTQPRPTPPTQPKAAPRPQSSAAPTTQPRPTPPTQLRAAPRPQSCVAPTTQPRPTPPTQLRAAPRPQSSAGPTTQPKPTPPTQLRVAPRPQSSAAPPTQPRLTEEDREREILEKIARTMTPINMRCATSSAVPVFECTVCDIRTNSESQLKQHMESAKHKYKSGTKQPPSRQVASSAEAALPPQPEVAPTPQTSVAPPTQSKVAPPMQAKVAPPTQSKVAPPTQFTAAPTTQPRPTPPTQLRAAPRPLSSAAPPPQSSAAPPPQPRVAHPPQPRVAPRPQPSVAPRPQPSMAPRPQPRAVPPSQSRAAPPTQFTAAPTTQLRAAPRPQPRLAPPRQPSVAPPTQPRAPPPPQISDLHPTYATEASERLQCQICKLQLETLTQLERHMSSHRSIPTRYSPYPQRQP